MEVNLFSVVGFLKTTLVLVVTRLLAFHKSASAPQVQTSCRQFRLEVGGVRVDDPAGADDHSGAETVQRV